MLKQTLFVFIVQCNLLSLQSGCYSSFISCKFTLIDQVFLIASLIQLKHEIEVFDWSKGREMGQGYLKEKIMEKFDKMTHVSRPV